MAKKSGKKSKKMTGRFPSKDGFVTRCKRIAKRAGTSVMDCERLFQQAARKAGKKTSKSKGKKR